MYTPIYDFVASYFKASRRKSIESLHINAGDKILILGAGTGLDLEFLPTNCEIIASDITPSMVERIKKRNLSLKRHVRAIEMDGQAIQFEDKSFDIVILHLILAVIPDPNKCIKEVERVLKKDGQLIVFDKFKPDNGKTSFLRRFLNPVTNLLFSDITREFESLHKVTELSLVSDKAANFNGNFRLIKLIK